MSNAVAQQSTSLSVPNLINYSGTVRDVNNAGTSKVLGVTFAIYNQAEGGAPLWSEIQNVTVTATGRYSVLLGSSSSTGLPGDLFSPAEPRWLGVKVEGQPEQQPRVLLVSVPYAMKAAEADTLSGHSAGEFVTTDTLQSAVKEQVQQQIGQPTASHTTAVGVSPNQNSSQYINNQTTQQVGANFNIDGNGTAATLNATSLYQLGGAPVLGSNGGQSLFLGTQAGQNNTGNENTFLGIASGQANTSGNFNTFVGKGAGSANTTGAFNTFIGRLAGQSNTTGQFNTFLGTTAGSSNTTGSYNFFLGGNAGYSNTTGAFNVMVGTGSGGQNTTGQSNTMFGNTSGAANTTGSYNAFFGGSSGVANTTGSANVFFGVNAGYNNTSGSNNVYVGVNSGLNADPAANNNLYFGSQGAPGESNTTRIGDLTNQTGAYIAGINGAFTNGGVPVFIDPTGKLGTSGNTSGLVTSVFGRSGNVFPQFGDYNFGQIAGTVLGGQLGGQYTNSVNLSSPSNMFNGNYIGNGSGLNGVMPAPGSNNYIQNTNMPQGANFNVIGNGTVGGLFTAQNGMQAFNTVAGNSAMLAVDNNTSGQSAGTESQTFNPAGVGVDGHAKATTGLSVGVQGQNDSTTGAGVIGVNSTMSGLNYGVLGYSGGTGGFGVLGASPNVGTAGTTQTCTAFGSCTLTTGTAGQFFTATGGTILQGLSGADLTSLAQVFAVDSSGNISGAGNLTAAGVHSRTVTGGVQVYVDASGHLGVLTSSTRFKEQIRDMGDGSAALMKLRPVTYFYKPQYDDGIRTLQYGLIAEEVARVYPELVEYETDGKPYTVKYQYLATMLLNEVQKQYHRAEAEAVVIAQQENRLDAQQQQIESLQKRLQMLSDEFQQRLLRLERGAGQQSVATVQPRQ